MPFPRKRVRIARRMLKAKTKTLQISAQSVRKLERQQINQRRAARELGGFPGARYPEIHETDVCQGCGSDHRLCLPG